MIRISNILGYKPNPCRGCHLDLWHCPWTQPCSRWRSSEEVRSETRALCRKISTAINKSIDADIRKILGVP